MIVTIGCVSCRLRSVVYLDWLLGSCRATLFISIAMTVMYLYVGLAIFLVRTSSVLGKYYLFFTRGVLLDIQSVSAF